MHARRRAARLEADHSGRRCAAGLSHFQDELIRVLYDYTVAHVYRATNPSDAERMAIVATGGYGRALLAPGSDIDLLFLLPYKQTAWGESVAEYMLYMLWDLGFKVGHATRTVDQCIKMSADVTVRTALLDARLIHGDGQLYGEFEERFRTQVVHGTARAFIDAKMAEHDARHRVAGESRYKVEPNVKDGKGGLRDLHTLHWLSKYLYGQGVGAATVAAGIFRPEEVATFRRCEDFLWTIRCFLHFLSGRVRGGADVRRAAVAGRPTRLQRSRRLARRRALHEALLPHRQGRRRPDDDPLLRAGDAAAQGGARAEPLLASAELEAAPAAAHAHRLPHRQRSLERRRSGRVQARSGEPHPLLRRGASFQLVPASRRDPAAAPVQAPDRRQVARRPRGQPHLRRAADGRYQSRDVAAAHERGRRAGPLRAASSAASSA